MSDETTVGGDELSARVGELRRLTFMYCDVVGSTELSGRLGLARLQRARPFELRIALDLHEIVGSEAAPLLEEAMRPFEDSPWIADLERTSR